MQCFDVMKPELSAVFKNKSRNEKPARTVKRLIAAIDKIEAKNNNANNAFCSSTSTMHSSGKNANDDDDAPSYDRKLFLPAYKKLKMSIEKKQKEIEEMIGEMKKTNKIGGYLLNLALANNYWESDEAEEIVEQAEGLLKFYGNYKQVCRFMGFNCRYSNWQLVNQKIFYCLKVYSKIFHFL